MLRAVAGSRIITNANTIFFISPVIFRRHPKTDTQSTLLHTHLYIYGLNEINRRWGVLLIMLCVQRTWREIKNEWAATTTRKKKTCQNRDEKRHRNPRPVFECDFRWDVDEFSFFFVLQCGQIMIFWIFAYMWCHEMRYVNNSDTWAWRKWLQFGGFITTTTTTKKHVASRERELQL